MELSVREWMIIIGVLLIVAVLLDGYRRVRSERRNRIRVTLSRQAMQRGIQTPNAPLEDDEREREVRAELPNGGARVIAKPRRDDLKLDEPVPVLMESVHIAPPVEAPPAADQPAAEGSGIEPSAQLDEAAADILATGEPERIEPHFAAGHDAAPAALEPEVEAEAEASPACQSTSLPNSAAQEVMIVNVISKDPAGFKGQDLLQILLACDLRFGNMNIFHRYEKANGKGAVQFSVANLVEPGTFDLDRIDSFSTPGLCFFLTLPGPEKAITAFNYMVETAQVLVKNLQGELRDEAHSVMTQQTIEHCRQRIRDFERKQLTLHL